MSHARTSGLGKVFDKYPQVNPPVAKTTDRLQISRARVGIARNLPAPGRVWAMRDIFSTGARPKCLYAIDVRPTRVRT